MAAFDEFLEQFLAAQVQASPKHQCSFSAASVQDAAGIAMFSVLQGFPITFSVLRREAPEQVPEEAVRGKGSKTAEHLAVRGSAGELLQ